MQELSQIQNDEAVDAMIEAIAENISNNDINNSSCCTESRGAL